MVLSRCRPLRSTRWRLPSGWRGRARGTRWAPAIGRRCATSRRSSRLSSGTRSRGPPNARDGNAPREMAPLGIPRGCPRDRRHARGHPRRGRPRRARARRRRPRPATVCVASRTPRGRPRRRRPPRARPPRAPTEARDARAGRQNWGSCWTGSGVPCSRWTPPRLSRAPAARPCASARRKPGRRPRRRSRPRFRRRGARDSTPAKTATKGTTSADPRWTPEPAPIAFAAGSWTTRRAFRRRDRCVRVCSRSLCFIRNRARRNREDSATIRDAPRVRPSWSAPATRPARGS